jgi:anti-sigma regulatory factor (Ser/Thr protein kinase)
MRPGAAHARRGGEIAPHRSGGPGGCHSAVVGASSQHLVELLLPVVRTALSLGEAVSVNLAAARLHALRAELRSDGERVTFTDTHRWHPHPARRLRAFETLLDERRRSGAGPSWFVGECAWPAGPPELLREWHRFDSLLDDLLAGSDVRMFCAYDASALPGEVVAALPATHPHLGTDPLEESSAYLPSEQFLTVRAPGRLLVPPGASRAGAQVSPAGARALVRQFARSRLGERRLDDLSVVVSELVTNSWRAAATRVEVSCWTSDGDVVTQVDDDASGFDDPYAGYRKPPTDSESGRGLWIARQLADLIEIAPRPGGTSVRVLMLAAPPLQHRSSTPASPAV